ncbi:hypothetical protein Vretifemale_11033 [Volvox reticuliferus]|uniref:Uncharacterized protein n=1 Tax=Volvox reticuliferus TaxID=1737510 RepID=A0A8J4FQQ9_9CHLO|nr:hypothetical protein Vretifemale_11033 [Volvox reticuliferus]
MCVMSTNASITFEQGSDLEGVPSSSDVVNSAEDSNTGVTASISSGRIVSSRDQIAPAAIAVIAAGVGVALLAAIGISVYLGRCRNVQRQGGPEESSSSSKRTPAVGSDGSSGDPPPEQLSRGDNNNGSMHTADDSVPARRLMTVNGTHQLPQPSPQHPQRPRPVNTILSPKVLPSVV